MSESMKSVRVTYDVDADAAYIYLQAIPAGGVERTIPVELANGEVSLDFDARGKLIGIEILGAGAVLPERFVL